MVGASKPSRALGWVSLSLLALGALAFVVPMTLFAFAAGNEGVPVGDGPREVHAPGERTWGVYFDDADNSGYSESCSVTDSNGQTVALREPGGTLSSSETEMLDHVFTTPADGRFTIVCSVESADARVGPVGDLPSVRIGLAGAALLGLGGLVTGIVWLTRRSSAPARAAAA